MIMRRRWAIKVNQYRMRNSARYLAEFLPVIMTMQDLHLLLFAFTCLRFESLMLYIDEIMYTRCKHLRFNRVPCVAI